MQALRDVTRGVRARLFQGESRWRVQGARVEQLPQSVSLRAHSVRRATRVKKRILRATQAMQMSTHDAVAVCVLAVAGTRENKPPPRHTNARPQINARNDPCGYIRHAGFIAATGAELTALEGF